MKVGIITFHTALNYGAVLQTYALFRTLMKLGVEVEVIDYRAPFNEKRFAPKPISYFFNPREIFNIVFRNSYQRFNSEGFKEFIVNHVNLSHPIYLYENLKELNKEFDVFITGSDQVWNLACTSGDDAYYLPFVDDNRKKNSYAASFGYTMLPTDKQFLYAKLLEGFNHISVREISGVEIIRSLMGKDAELVLDPTLLLDKNEWETLADFSLLSSKKYMLMYLMSEDKGLIDKAKEYAKKHDLEIIYLTQRLFNVRGVRNVKNATPEQWLGLFLRAEAVATNSFHGLVFSINFGKHFITKYIPRSIANSRIETMISGFGLQRNLVDSPQFDMETDTDVDKISRILLEKRQSSINYIERIIND